MPDLEDLIRLNLIRGIGPVLQRRLVDHFGSVADIFKASHADLSAVHGIGPKIAQTIVRSRDEIDLSHELDLIREFGVNVVTVADAHYPRNLKTIPSPPLLLYVMGTLKAADALSVALVGTRRASIYGLNASERLAADLARRGATVVSGLALGVDTAAHRGALKALGRTIAVIGSGLATIYPPGNADLAREIAANGAVVSEFPMLYPVEAGNFPRRNRIISGLSLGVVVVEAGRRSGALITARWAGEQGREVMAVPGRIDAPTSQGANRLLRDGAAIVTSAEDILGQLGPLDQPVATDFGDVIQPPELSLSDIEWQVVNELETSEPRIVDEIVARTGLPVSTVSSVLLILQTRGLVRQLVGARFVRAQDLFSRPDEIEPAQPPPPPDQPRRWRCRICQAVIQRPDAPSECRFCGADAEAFVED